MLAIDFDQANASITEDKEKKTWSGRGTLAYSSSRRHLGKDGEVVKIVVRKDHGQAGTTLLLPHTSMG
jgi:hypothetical protein